MKYFNVTYFDSLEHAATKRDLNGTSISSEKGTDGKANNTSAYNHDYYMRNKEKWQDNKSSSDKKGDKNEDKEFDVDAAAMDVIRGRYGNGEDRKKALGDDYEMIQRRVNEIYKEKGWSTKGGSSSESSGNGEKKEDKKKGVVQSTFEKYGLAHSDIVIDEYVFRR